MGRTVTALVTWDDTYLGAIGPFAVDVPWWAEVEPVVAHIREALGVPAQVITSAIQRMVAAQAALAEARFPAGLPDKRSLAGQIQALLDGPAYAVRYQEFLDGIEPSERIYHRGDPAASIRAALVGVGMSAHIARLRAAVGHDLLLLPSVSVLPVDDAGRLLLVRHADHHDGWGVLGGAVEIGESPAEAAVRETREEIGA